MSEIPPPYTAPPVPPPQKKGPNVLVIILAILFALCLLCGLGGYLIYYFGKDAVNSAVGSGTDIFNCSIKMSLIRDAVVDYARDHDGAFPPAENWQAEVAPYVKDLKDAPEFMKAGLTANGELACGDIAKTGIAYNSDLVGKNMNSLTSADVIPVLYEVDKISVNAHGPYQERPHASSPKLLGEPRGWMVIHVYGDAKATSKFGN